MICPGSSPVHQKINDGFGGVFEGNGNRRCIIDPIEKYGTKIFIKFFNSFYADSFQGSGITLLFVLTFYRDGHDFLFQV